MAKAFSIEDGNLSDVPLTSAVSRTYKDIDLSFTNRPSGDIYKKTDAAAVKQSIKNILLTNATEKPFRPVYGGDLNRFLFSLEEEFDEISIKERITLAIGNYEPRAVVLEVTVDPSPEQHTLRINVKFQMITTFEIDSVQVSLTRLR